MLNKSKEDSDGDGVPDDQEVQIVLKYNEDKSKMYVQGKLISYPDRVDSDMDGISDQDDPNPMEYTITDRTLSLVAGLSYTNLEEYVGRSVKDARKDGVYFKNVAPRDIFYLDDAIIVYANDSGADHPNDYEDAGLASLALKFVRSNKRTAVVYSPRGTEFTDNFVYDFVYADLTSGVWWDNLQSRIAYMEYKAITSKNRNYDYYITAHSLGGRITQDVLYKVYNANGKNASKTGISIITPVHNATFNGLGYINYVYASLRTGVLNRYRHSLVNFYYEGDIVGELFGCSAAYKRAGVQVNLMRRNWKGDTIKNHIKDNHGILCWSDDKSLTYEETHKFPYWVD